VSNVIFVANWNYVLDRTHSIADQAVFIIPVAIDDTPPTTALVPERFRAAQWERLLDGEVTSEFA
jgi:hypothetical protein